MLFVGVCNIFNVAKLKGLWRMINRFFGVNDGGSGSIANRLYYTLNVCVFRGETM